MSRELSANLVYGLSYLIDEAVDLEEFENILYMDNDDINVFHSDLGGIVYIKESLCKAIDGEGFAKINIKKMLEETTEKSRLWNTLLRKYCKSATIIYKKPTWLLFAENT